MTIKKAKPNEFFEEAISNNLNMRWSNEERKHALDVTYRGILAERVEYEKVINDLKKENVELKKLILKVSKILNGIQHNIEVSSFEEYEEKQFIKLTEKVQDFIVINKLYLVHKEVKSSETD